VTTLQRGSSWICDVDRSGGKRSLTVASRLGVLDWLGGRSQEAGV